MKLLLFTDIHGDRNALNRVVSLAPNADLLVCAGDISSDEAVFNSFMGDLSKTGKPVLAIHGNHETDDMMKAACRKYPNIIFLHKGCYEMGNLKFMGWGGGGFSSKDNEFEHVWNRFFRSESGTGHRIVLVTHAPPYNTAVDLVHNEYRGNQTLRAFIDEHQPVLVVCGHLHENFGKYSKIGNSFVINPGPNGVLFEIV